MPQPVHVPPQPGPASPQTSYWLPRPLVPPGWYPDPQADGQRRWWNGWSWTDHTAAG